jgi:hypothetical protein
VYGQVLLATIVLGVLASLGRVLETGTPLSPGRAAAWAVALGLGSTCFGMGLGLAAVFPIATALTLPREQLPWRSAGVLVLGAAAALGAYQLFRSCSMGAWDQEIFSVGALVRARATALVLFGHLVAFGTTTLLLGFLGLDRGYPDAIASATVVTGAAAVLAALSSASASRRRVLLALALLAVAAYGSVVLGRANLFAVLGMSLSSVVSTSPRYQYLPVALLAAFLSTAVATLAARGQTVRRAVRAGAVLWTASRVVLLATDPLTIEHWAQERADCAAFVKMVRDTVAATPPGQVALIENRPFGPKRGLPDALIGSVGAFVIFFPDDTVDGRTVRFGVDAHDWELAQKKGGRVAALVVPRAPLL